MSAVTLAKAKITERVAEAAVGGVLGLTGLQVTYGHPGNNAEQECFFVDTASEDDSEFAAIGDLSQIETFSLDFYISVKRPGDEQQEATERAFEIYDAIRNLLNADPTLDGIANRIPLLIRRRRTVEDFDTEGRSALILGQFQLESKID